MHVEFVEFEPVGSREVESIVLEELSVSESFRSWFVDRLDFDAGYTFSDEARVADAESDPTAESETPDGDPKPRPDASAGLDIGGTRVLVDLTTVVSSTDELTDRSNIDDRPPRETGEWNRYRSVLIASTTTIEETPAAVTSTFDATCSLESIRDRLDERGTERGDYRAAVVTAAIGRDRWERREAETESEPTPEGGSPAIRRYRTILSDRNPDLVIDPRPDLEDPVRESLDDERSPTTVEIDAPELAPDHRLVHAFEPGTVDLVISGAADHLESFAVRYAGVIQPTTELLAAGDALVLRRSVPTIDPLSPDGTAMDPSDGAADLDAVVDPLLETIDAHLAVSMRVRERSR